MVAVNDIRVRSVLQGFFYTGFISCVCGGGGCAGTEVDIQKTMCEDTKPKKKCVGLLFSS